MNKNTQSQLTPRALKAWSNPRLICHGTVAQLTKNDCPPNARGHSQSACGIS